jgi:hypothetical protein
MNNKRADKGGGKGIWEKGWKEIKTQKGYTKYRIVPMDGVTKCMISPQEIKPVNVLKGHSQMMGYPEILDK